MKKKTVYISLSVDILHHGHINLIEQAKKYGSIVAGLLTDKAIASAKRLPLLDYYQRKKILQNINGVDKVVQQNEWDYTPNLLKITDYIVHEMIKPKKRFKSKNYFNFKKNWVTINRNSLHKKYFKFKYAK